MSWWCWIRNYNNCICFLHCDSYKMHSFLWITCQSKILISFIYSRFVVQFMQNHGSDLCNQISCLEWLPVKFHILIMALINEFQVMYRITAESGTNRRSDLHSTENVDDPNSEEASVLIGKFIKSLVGTLVGFILCTYTLSFKAYSDISYNKHQSWLIEWNQFHNRTQWDIICIYGLESMEY